jgi:hypothetical protein
MNLLLESSNSGEIVQSELLLQETYAALRGKPAGFELLLQHKALVNCGNGSAVQAAAVEGSLAVLEKLLSSKPSFHTLNRACLATETSALNRTQKCKILNLLLTANGGISAKDKSKLLTDSVATLPQCTVLVKMLLASQTHISCATLKVAIETSTLELFILLVGALKKQGGYCGNTYCSTAVEDGF